MKKDTIKMVLLLCLIIGGLMISNNISKSNYNKCVNNGQKAEICEELYK